MLAQNRKICGRGVLALKSWEPLRRPGPISKQKTGDNSKNSNQGQQIPVAPSEDNGQSSTLLVKYSYKANPDRPGGFHEITVKQGQKVQFLNVHPSQPLWWQVKEQNGGSTGYVPASYMMILENKPSGLPWLENRRLEEQKEESKPKPGTFGTPPVNVWKPYVSAYGAGETAGANSQERKYYCGICDKQLNGPKPYQAHMVSKAHKEEVEAQS